MSLTDGGEMTITKSETTIEGKEYFVVAYPKGKDINSYPKKSIKIKKSQCDGEKLELKEVLAIKDTYKSVDGKTTSDLEFTKVEAWFKINPGNNDKCKVESYTLKIKKDGKFEDLPDLDGHSGYKVASPSSILVSDPKPLQIHLDHKVNNYIVYVQAKMTGGATIEKELDITVPAFECDATKTITLAEDTTKEFLVSKPGSGDATTLVTKTEDIKKLFKFETEKKSKKEDCKETKYKLVTEEAGFVFKDVTSDDLVNISSAGELTITKDKAPTDAK